MTDLIIRKLVITLIVVAFMFVPLLIIAPASAQDTGVYAEKICSCVFSEDTHTLIGFTYPIQPPGRYFYIVTAEGNVITPMGQASLTQDQIAMIQNVPYIPYAGEFTVTNDGWYGST